MSQFFSKYKKEVVVAVFVFLIVTLAFGLGYLIASRIAVQTPIVFEQCSDK